MTTCPKLSTIIRILRRYRELCALLRQPGFRAVLLRRDEIEEIVELLRWVGIDKQ